MTMVTTELEALFPGREVDVAGVKVVVYPATLAKIGEVIRVMADVGDRIVPVVEKLIGGQVDDASLVGEIVGVLRTLPVESITGLMAGCVNFDVNAKIPHHVWPAIIGAWVEENFGEGKTKGWATLIGRVKAVLPGR